MAVAVTIALWGPRVDLSHVRLSVTLSKEMSHILVNI